MLRGFKHRNKDRLGLTILTSISALEAQRQLTRHTNDLVKIQERLSSGLRLDNGAEYSIAAQLRVEQRIANAAIRNVNDGISLLSVTDGALDEINSILIRMAEVAEASANGIHDMKGRSHFQAEFAALGSEIARIAASTKFNNIKLLSGTSAISFQVGFDSHSNSRVSFSGVFGTLNKLKLGNAAENLTYSVSASNAADSQNAALTALDAVMNAMEIISKERGEVGAAESRLTVTLEQLQVQRENLDEARSRIEDVDVAREAAELIRVSILRDASAAILGQANQEKKLALKLLN